MLVHAVMLRSIVRFTQVAMYYEDLVLGCGSNDGPGEAQYRPGGTGLKLL